jgi:L-ascorbate metabolism protein UlaG (beta-lactamase superfamily)
MHYGTFPVLTGTPSELETRVKHLGVQIIPLKPGETKVFS